MEEPRRIGITTTIPVEIIFAANAIPVDLNNLFIADEKKEKLIERAEIDGYPRNICPWIKGIYGAVMSSHIEEVVVVMQGDCSNSQALAETLQLNGITVYPFSYPYDGNRKALEREMQKLMDMLGVKKWEDVEYWKFRLDQVRKVAHEIDELTWKKNVVKGFENHRYLVATSDFEGDPDVFVTRLNNFIDEVHNDDPLPQEVRLAYIGVPPLFGDIYDILEEYGARVVFNEVQRQFSMPFKSDDVVDQYMRYTYPYPIFRRIVDIRREIAKRKIHGIIHYAESFCFRQIEDIIFRKELKLPYILVEGGTFKVDARTKMRLQAFVEMLKEKIAIEENEENE
ncbi:2-hydroxyacyl-CoA dehydratase [bacterium]|nr:2-hydroxyacyl-CoA dehydratase [bacterium]